LGLALAGRGQFDEAIGHFEKGLSINRDDAQMRKNLGLVRSQLEALMNSLAQRREQLRLHPDDLTLMNDTAWMLATNPNASIRNGAEAVELARRAVQLDEGREPAILGTLAAALAEAGRFPEAVETARKALALATQQNKPSLIESVKVKLPLYEAGTPFREMEQPSAAHADSP
jgi:tetratricopeptide (TPR) repeat protein